MAIYETFSKRSRKAAQAGQPDVYQYEILPAGFRIQTINIRTNAIGPYFDERGNYGEGFGSWTNIHSTIAHELGIHSLGNSHDLQDNCVQFIERGETNQVLDLIEYCLLFISNLSRRPDDKYTLAISELNYRFIEHGLGYQFETERLIRVDSAFVHAEVVKPALSLLHEVAFHGASEEFIQAHDHYRGGRYPEAIAGALKAFESTMKAICEIRRWPYPSNATSRALIDIIIKNGLVPAELASEFSSLRTLLESGLPTVRNRAGGHGQGKDPIAIPSYLAGYALHLAAANIVFLGQAHKALG
jgi:hypothetical protein